MSRLNYGQLDLWIGEGNGSPFQYSCLENPWTEEPAGSSTGSWRVGHDWVTELQTFECPSEGLMLKRQYRPPDAKSRLMERTPRQWKAEGKRRSDDRGWDSLMASPTQWMWVWANSRRWWSTGKPGMLRSVGSQRVGHNLVTEKQDLWQARATHVFKKGMTVPSTLTSLIDSLKDNWIENSDTQRLNV